MQYADPTFIVLCLSAITDLVLIIAVLRNPGLRLGFHVEPDGPVQITTSQLLLVFMLASLGWVVMQGLLRLHNLHLIVGFDPYALERFALYFLLLMAVFFLQLTRHFQRKQGSGLNWWIAGGIWLAITLLLYENPLRLPDTLLAMGPNVVMRWLLAFAVIVAGWGLFVAFSVILTIRAYKATLSPLHRNRMKYWSLAVCLGIAGQGLCLAQQPLAGNLLQMLAAISMAYVLLTFHLPDLRMAARRSASYLVMLVITVAVYTAGFYALQRLFGGAPWYNPLVGGAIVALVLAILFNPLLNLVQRFVSRWITGSRYDVRQTLSEYSMSISNILDMEVLATIVVGLISEAMEITHGALVTVHYEPGEDFWDENSGRYLLRSNSGLGQEMPEGHLSGKNPAVYYLKREHRPLTQYDIDLLPRFHGMNADERNWLTSLKMDVYVPIYAKDNWIGLLGLGAKTSGDRYYDEDLSMLQTLADQTAVALENARLYQDLKLRNADNERLNAELKNANAELARLDQAKSDFINIASHELRTPLTQVIGYNDILGEMIKAEDLQKSVGVQMVDSVRKAARRLEEIVETMFDVSKLDTKTLDLMRAPVSLSSVISVAIDMWSKGMEERKQTISVRGVSNLPIIVADGKRLTQVFSHLIQNAIKSTPDGGQIRITGRVVTMGADAAAATAAAVAGTVAGAVGSAAAAAEPVTPTGPGLVPATFGRKAANAGGGKDGGRAIAAEGNRAAAGNRAASADLPTVATNGKRTAAGETANAAQATAQPQIESNIPASVDVKTGERFPASALASAANAAKIKAEIPPSIPGDRYVEIVIADTGIGIAPDDLERIFEKFYRVGNVLLHSTGDTKFKGAGPGLGLTIARGIVEAHGGRIWAESPGHDEESCPGSRFHVLLPIKELKP